MKNNTVLTDVLKLLVGEVILDAVMILVFLLIDKLSPAVFLGAALGTAANTVCYALLCLSVDRVIANGDKTKGKATMTVSFLVRLVILGLSLAVGFKFDTFNTVSVIVPVLSTRPILTVYSLFGKEKKGDRS